MGFVLGALPGLDYTRGPAGEEMWLSLRPNHTRGFDGSSLSHWTFALQVAEDDMAWIDCMMLSAWPAAGSAPVSIRAATIGEAKVAVNSVGLMKPCNHGREGN
jgi:hypothetical protein